MTSALEGTRVLDCSSGIAGPLAAMLLADFGADVVKVEPPAGDPGRAHPGFAVWNRGKRTAVVDPDSAADRSRLASLLAAADVCVVNASEARLRGSVLEPATASETNPALVYLHLPPFARGVPWVGQDECDPLLAARTGVSLRQASVEGVPVDSVYPHLVTIQGIWGAAAAAAALVERQRSGYGQHVTVAGIHGAMVASAGAFTFDPTLPEPVGPRPGGGGGSVPFYRTYQCGDGNWLFLAALTPRFTELAFAVLGISDLMHDPRLEGKGRAAMLLPDHARWVIDTIGEVFRRRPRQVWLDELAAAGCPAGPLLERDAWLDHPQIVAIGMRVAVDDPERGEVVMPGIPLHLTGSPGRVTGPAPSLGAASLIPDWTLRPVPSGGAWPNTVGPLDGVRVLDLGAIIAGPFAASLLAELGADVIKVEPLTGDSFRGPGFAAYNKGQRGIAIDLRHSDGRDTFLRLVRDADVVVDNYRPGVLGRLRLQYEDLCEVNPSIITLSVTGFGDDGPLRDEPGFDPVLQAMSGMMTAQGGDGDPVMFTVPVNDVATAAMSALGVCLALFHRSRTGTGQRLWTSLAGMSALLQAGQIVRFAGRGAADIGGPDHPGPSPIDCYRRVADGWVRIAASDADGDALAQLLDGGLLKHTRADVVEQLTAAGIAAAPAQRMSELVGDPDGAGFDVLHQDPRPGREHWWTSGRHALFSRTERAGTLVSPSLGQHTREILTASGLAPERIEQLIANAVIAAR